MSDPIDTVNACGWTNTRPNEAAAAFVAFVGRAGGCGVDIGAAFGVATLPALHAGAHMFANDIDPRHLAALAAGVPAELKPRLGLLPGRFPDEVDLPEASVDGVLLSNVLHFLRGAEIERGLARVAAWLRPGGRMFVLACTPWVGNQRELLPQIEARVRAGIAWPGECDDIHSTITLEPKAGLPAFLHPLTKEILAPRVTAAGLVVVEARHFTRQDIPPFARLDGRENLLLIAAKP